MYIDFILFYTEIGFIIEIEIAIINFWIVAITIKIIILIMALVIITE